MKFFLVCFRILCSVLIYLFPPPSHNPPYVIIIRLFMRMTGCVGPAGYFHRMKFLVLGLRATLPNPRHIYWLELLVL